MIQRALLSLGTLIMMALLAEVVVRFALHAEVDTDALEQANTALSILPIIRYSRDPELLYELEPGIDVEFQGVPVSIDDKGERASPGRGKDDPPPDAVRIAVLGDSTSFGWGVRHSDAYPERLRKALQKRLKKKIHLRNFSVPGYNAHQEQRVFGARIAPFEPDLVVLHHDHNDSEPIGKFNAPLSMHPGFGENVLHSALIKLLHRRLKLLQYRSQYWLEEIDGRDRYVGSYLESGRLYDAHLEARRGLVQAAKAQDAPVIAVLFNCCVEYDEHYEEREPYRRLHEKLESALAEMGYHVLDLYPEYQRLMGQRGWQDLVPISLSDTDRHPNPKGHIFIANQIVRYASQSGLLQRLDAD